MDTNDTLMLILSELRDIKSDISGLHQNVKKLEQGQNELQLDVKGLQQDVKGLQQDVKELQQGQEILKRGQNELKQNLATVLEAINFVQHNEQEHFEVLSNKVLELETVIKQNSYDITKLRAAQ